MKTNSYFTGNTLAVVCAAAVWAIPSSVSADKYSDVVRADNPAAYFRFEEQPGESMLLDSSAGGTYNGTYFSPDGIYPRLGKPGIDTNSAFFHPYVSGDGTPQNPYAEVPYAPELNAAGPFTAEVWARATSASAAEYRSPLSNFGGWTDSSGWFVYQSPEAGGPSKWIWVQKGGGIWVGGVNVRKFAWDHLVGVFDGKDVSFYVNGVFAGKSEATNALPNSGAALRIGTRDSGYGYFDGNVDEVAVYTNALSADRVRLHYEVGRTNISNRPASPEVVQDPASTTNYAGRQVKFTVGADGTAPLAYQWYKGNALVSGATNDALVFAAAASDDKALYKVVITNAYGSVTSAPAALNVSQDLFLISSPVSITRKVGSKAALMAVAGGAAPVTYQWFKNGTVMLAGQTNQTLWLTNLTLADDNSTYLVSIRYGATQTNSDAATLTVQTRETPVPLTSRYAKIVMQDDPVAFWRLDEAEGSTIATDAVGSFDGAYAPGDGSFTYGQTNGIPGETNRAVSITGGARVAIPWALELNPRGPFTAEGWFKPSSTAANSSDYRTVFSSMHTPDGGPYGWLLYQQPDNRFAWVLFDKGWNSTFVADTVDTVEANKWYHIALSYDGKLFHIFVNGNQVASAPYDIFNANPAGAFNIGWRSDNDFKSFQGTVDDVAVYNKALTLDQVRAHFAAATKLNISHSGTNVILSWTSGTLESSPSMGSPFVPVASPSPYTNAITGSSKFFRVKME